MAVSVTGDTNSGYQALFRSDSSGVRNRHDLIPQTVAGNDEDGIDFAKFKDKTYSMKNKVIPISLVIAITFVSCEKENSDLKDLDFNYDCYESNISYTEGNELQYQEKYFYFNNLIVRTDCSPRYIWNYEYDSQNNLTKFESEKGSYFLYHYDAVNRCTISEQFVEDTLYLRTIKFYSDTLLSKEYLLHKNGDTLSTVYYYYNDDNQIDSVISDRSKTYHSYSLDNHTITKISNNNIKFYESITTYENGFTTQFEEYYYNENSELYKSFIESKEYDNNKNLIKRVIEQFDLYSNSNHYDEIGYLYDSMGRKIRSDSYDVNNNLLSYKEYIYDGDRLSIIQSYDSDGNKIGYTLIENTCK